jgi:hypothetical protein
MVLTKMKKNGEKTISLKFGTYVTSLDHKLYKAMRISMIKDMV